MPSCAVGTGRSQDLRRQIERLDGLPLRPSTVCALLAPSLQELETSRARTSTSLEPAGFYEIDPGWIVAQFRGPVDPLEVVSQRSWWRAPVESVQASWDHLWRHSVAASRAAVQLATEYGLADPERLGSMALLTHLGLWGLAAVAPENLSELLIHKESANRRQAAYRLLGTDLETLGRDLVDRWGGPTLLANTVWLQGLPLADATNDFACPIEQRLLQEAQTWADSTPWRLTTEPNRQSWIGPDRNGSSRPSDRRILRLVAEVQTRCGAHLAVSDASNHEELLAQAHARLLLRNATVVRSCRARDHVLDALAGSLNVIDPLPDGEAATPDRGASDREGSNASPLSSDSGPEGSGTSDVVDRAPLSRAAGWRLDRETEPWWLEAAGTSAATAWRAWKSSRERSQSDLRLLNLVSDAYRHHVERDGEARQLERLDALAEFAAGAAHELNNPLAVILGRAQLVLSRGQSDGEASRSLRAIIGQAQRAHRILRDLMYVARPPQPRVRRVLADATLRSAVDDLRPEAEARNVGLECRVPESLCWTWADPDALRHLAEVFLRNALETTSPGRHVWAIGRTCESAIVWVIRDQGPGMDLIVKRHLFDPFYCGREAGRGLGLGLSRSVRFVAQAGGTLRCQLMPGRGTSFRITIPSGEPVAMANVRADCGTAIAS